MSDEISRRGFLELSAGVLGAAALADSAQAQVDGADPDPDAFEHYAWLLGPDRERPEPGGEYLSQWDSYRFIYLSTDTGERYSIDSDDPKWEVLPMSLQKYETGFGFPAVRNSRNRVDAPSTYSFNTGRHRLVVNGSIVTDPSTTTAFADPNGAWQVTPSGGDTVEFGVREKTRYVPNYELLWGCSTWAETALSSGQRFFVEYTDDDRDNGYRYRFESDTWYVEQLSGGSVVDSHDRPEWDIDPRDDGLDLTEPFVCRNYLNWYGAGSSRYTFSFPDSDGKMVNDTVDRTFNPDGIATENVNNRVKVVAESDVGAGSFTVNIGSFGTLIQGQAQEFDRAKIGVHWDLGGSISQQFTQNDPVLAIRIDPDRANTAVQIPTPVFAPNAETMQLEVFGVLESETDADFQDPDGDGTDEGPVYANAQPQNSVIQWTRNVSTYPTRSTLRPDGQGAGNGSTGTVPDGRQIANGVSVGSGNKNEPPIPSAGGTVEVKRTLYPGEVALFIPRTAPSSSTTAGSIDFIESFSEQDR